MVKMGLLKRIRNAARELVRPTADLNDEALLEWLGITTKNKKEIGEVTYFTCLKMLSETMGKLPLKYYRETGRGRIRADPTTAGILMTVRPNPFMTPTTMWTTVEQNCQHYGNGYIWIRKSTGGATRSWTCGPCSPIT